MSLLNARTCCCALFVLFTGCASLRHAPLLGDGIPQEDNSIVLQTAAEHYINGKAFLRRGEVGTALRSFEMALLLDTGSVILTDQVISLSLAAGQPGVALRAIQRGREITSISDDEKRQISVIYARYQMFEKALETISMLTEFTASDSVLLGNLYETNGKYREAIAIYESQLSDTLFDTRLKFADLYRKSGQFSQAEERFRVLLNISPENNSVRKGLSFTLLALDRGAEAEIILTELLAEQHGTQDPVVREGLGRYYASVGNLASAIEQFQILYKGTESLSDYSYGRTLAVYHFMNRNYSEAQTLFTVLLDENQDDHELWYLLAATCEGAGDFEAADEAYTKSLTINPDFLDALQGKTLLQLRMAKVDAAHDMGRIFVERFPDEANAWAMMGSIYNIQQNYDSAYIALRKAVVLGTNSPGLYFELGIAAERTQKFKEAEKMFRRTLKLDTAHAAAANYLGYMWAEQGSNLADAEQLLLLALRIEPDNGAFLDSYGWILYQQGRYKEALPPLLRSAELIKNDYIVYYHLGDLYDKLGESQEALRMYLRANSFENPDFDYIAEKIKKNEDILLKNEGLLH